MLTGLEITGEVKRGQTKENMEVSSPPAVLHVTSLAAFKKDKLIGWLNDTESKGANYINDKVKSTIVTFPCSKEENVGVELDTHKIKGHGPCEKWETTNRC